MAVREAFPVTLLTGFLGSGKTTLLRRLLTDPGMADTAVLVNELGEIGLDHELLRTSAETVVLMESGCLCCALRTDLAAQLDELYGASRRKEIPAFSRVVIETTGLADPGPILQTLASDRIIATLYRLDNVVTTVDGVHGNAELDAHFESVKQAAVADRIVITKTDIADPDALAALERRIRTLNPAAEVLRAAHGEIDPARLLGGPERPRFVPVGSSPGAIAGPRESAHDRRIAHFPVVYDAPVDGAALWRGLERLIDAHGECLLRVKGLVNTGAQAGPKVLHIVQHVLYPVVTLAGWPDDDRRTRLTFIVRDLDADLVRRTLDEALAGAVS